jgi:hypothetical protein
LLVSGISSSSIMVGILILFLISSDQDISH